jgi:NADPH-dependent 2,4-dienoyl-CoA reductase/sulfur reductase-like enzyme
VVERLVVVGADAAGMSAASQAKRLRPDLEVVALERGSWTSYSACGIPYLVGGEIPELDQLVARSAEDHRANGIDVRLGHEVVGLDPAAGAVHVRDHAGDRTFELGYDQLLLATGSRPVRPDLPGIGLPSVRSVQTLDDAGGLLDQMRAQGCRRVVVVGGGYIGLEMAEAFIRHGAEVVLIEGGQQLMSTLDPDMAERLVAPLEGLGVEVRLGARAAGFEAGWVHLDDGAELAADLVVLGLGVRPDGGLAAEAGADLGVHDAIAVDRRQRTSVDGIWAAGDCCTSHHIVSGRQVHVALGTVANKQGRVAGTNLGGGYARFAGVVGTAITRVCQYDVARTGLTEREAAAAAIVVETATVESTVHAGYLPDAPPMVVKLLAERGSGRLVGGQIFGGPGAGKRIDTIATALHARLRVDEVVDLDLAYAPPMGTVWDPVALAARRLA